MIFKKPFSKVTVSISVVLTPIFTVLVKETFKLKDTLVFFGCIVMRPKQANNLRR